MRITILIAGALAACIAAGHFIVGIKAYLKPMLEADFEKIPRVVMQMVFHYISVFLVLSAAALIVSGLGLLPGDNGLAAQFIGLNYLLFAAVQIFYALKSGVSKPLLTMFQWTLFVPVGILVFVK